MRCELAGGTFGTAAQPRSLPCTADFLPTTSGYLSACNVGSHSQCLLCHLAAGLQRALLAGLPISDQETLFSTPEDLQALEALFRWAGGASGAAWRSAARARRPPAPLPAQHGGGNEPSRRRIATAPACLCRVSLHTLGLPSRRPSRSHPYPTHNCYIRRGHGFLLLAQSVREAAEHLEQLVLPLALLGSVRRL